MKETYGVPVEEIQEAIKHGVRKINIDTDIRLAMTGAVRKFLAENPEKFDAREWLKPAREAAKQICKQRYIEFGCEGQAAQDQGRTLHDVAQQVRQGRAGADSGLSAARRRTGSRADGRSLRDGAALGRGQRSSCGTIPLLLDTPLA